MIYCKCEEQAEACTASMEKAWETLLREILNTPLWLIVTQGLKLPDMEGFFVPRLQWHFVKSQSLEDMWFADADMFSMSDRTLRQWKKINSSHIHAVEYLADKPRSSGKFQLEFGPAVRRIEWF